MSPVLYVNHRAFIETEQECPCVHRDGTLRTWLRWFFSAVKCDESHGSTGGEDE